MAELMTEFMKGVIMWIAVEVTVCAIMLCLIYKDLAGS
jgi:hypothetical protein